MLLSVAITNQGSVDAARRTMRNLLLSGERRVHAAKESPSRRRLVLDAVGRIDGLSAVVIRLRRPDGVGRLRGRHPFLQAATGFVVSAGVASWSLDDQDVVQRARDRASIAHALAGLTSQLAPTYDHRSSYGEPLLWAADAIRWAAGAGGDWRRRLGHVMAPHDLRP